MPIKDVAGKTVYFPDDMSDEEMEAIIDRDVSRATNLAGMFRKDTRAPRMRRRGRKLATQEYLDAASLSTAPIPVVGDVTGLLADFNMYANEPDSRNWFNYLFTAAGVLPLVPGAMAIKKAREEAETFAKKKNIPKFSDMSRNKKRATVRDPQRVGFPGVYKDPRKIIEEVDVAPESPNLKLLFNTSRKELADIANRSGNIENPELPGVAAKPKGSVAAENIMTNRNTQRLLDVLSEAAKRDDLFTGMKGWYVLDPAFQRLDEMYGTEQAKDMYDRLNTLTGMASPGSDVMTEINRGTAANALFNQGKFDDFMQFGGLPKGDPRIPESMANVKSHAYHKTAQSPAMQQYLDTGEVQLKSPKVPMYIQASSVPEVGFQTRIPVGDAHFSRAVGLADTRTGKADASIKGSVSTPEMQTYAPYFEKNIAQEMDLESVPAQAITWGAFSKQTGVTTPVGAPKLELLADQIATAAKRENVDPLKMRDDVLSGKKIAGSVDPALLALLAAGGVSAMATPTLFGDEFFGGDNADN